MFTPIQPATGLAGLLFASSPAPVPGDADPGGFAGLLKDLSDLAFTAAEPGDRPAVGVPESPGEPALDAAAFIDGEPTPGPSQTVALRPSSGTRPTGTASPTTALGKAGLHLNPSPAAANGQAADLAADPTVDLPAEHTAEDSADVASQATGSVASPVADPSGAAPMPAGSVPTRVGATMSQAPAPVAAAAGGRAPITAASERLSGRDPTRTVVPAARPQARTAPGAATSPSTAGATPPGAARTDSDAHGPSPSPEPTTLSVAANPSPSPPPSPAPIPAPSPAPSSAPASAPVAAVAGGRAPITAASERLSGSEPTRTVVPAARPQARTAPGAATSLSTPGATPPGAARTDSDAHGPSPSTEPSTLSVAANPSPSPSTSSSPSPSPAAATAPAPAPETAPARTAEVPPAGRDAIAWQGRLDAEVGSDTFGPALGLQLSTLARDGVQHARLHLNPVELGPITVKIALDGAGARVDFQADAAFTRAAIESSLPSLAGAMREAGLTLTGGGVFQQPQDRPSNGGGAGNGSAANPRHDDRREAEPLPGPMRPISIRRGLVDLVA